MTKVLVGMEICGGKWFLWLKGLTTNILPTNEATLSTFTCSASSNHQNIIQLPNDTAQPRIFLYFVPRKLPAIKNNYFT